MEYVHTVWVWLQDVAVYPLFSIGATQINMMRLVGLGVILLFAWWVSYTLERALVRLTKRAATDRMSESGMYALGRIVRYLLWILGSVLGLNFLGFDLASLAVVGGAVGIGVGLGLQNVVSNFVSGIIILLEKTLKVGDFVDLQSGVMGRVAEINLRYTRVTTNDSVDIIVPNSEFTGGRVINWTFGEDFRRIHIPFGVAYGTDKSLVREAGIAAANSVEGTVTTAGREPDVWLVQFGDSSLNFELVVWVGLASVSSPGRTQARYLWAIEDELRRRGIEIPFPQRDLHVRSGKLAVTLERQGQKGGSS